MNLELSYDYRSDNLLNHPRTAGVVMQNITFPSPHPSNFAVTERSHHGHPQVVTVLQIQSKGHKKGVQDKIYYNWLHNNLN